MESLARDKMWKVKQTMLRETDSGLNNPREISNNLALRLPGSSELGAIDNANFFVSSKMFCGCGSEYSPA